MARRAVSALTAIFAFAVAPVALLIGGTTPASAATATASQLPATVAFTGLSPAWASPGTTLTVTGIVKNTAGVRRQLIVQLLDSAVPISSVSALQQSAAAGTATGQAPLVLPKATWWSPVLRPGATASWSFHVPASVLGLTRFGVYPLAAQVSDTQGDNLVNTLTYVPYVPAGNGPYRSSIPAVQKISWVWPLMDQPLLREPWQSPCKGSQAAALAQSLTSGGRLGQLIDAAGAAAGTAAVQAQSAQAAASRAAQRLATLAEPGQSLAQDDAVTWAVDPALLVNVTDLSQCGASEPRWARTAAAWLARLKAETSSQPIFVTPYGNPDVTALIGGHAPDVQNAFFYGRRRAGGILGRNLAPAPVGTSPADTAGLAWSAGGPTSYAAAEILAGQSVGTLLEGSSAFPLRQVSVLRTLDGAGGAGAYMNVLLASDSLTSLLGSAGTGPGSAFATAQQFLAETALLAQQHPSTPIIVAPPQRWQPPAGLAAALLSDTASAPWLAPATLMSLTGATHVPSVSLPLTTSGSALSSLEQGQLSALDAAVSKQAALRAESDPNLSLAVSTVESSAYSGARFRETALGMIETLAARMERQERAVHIVAENRITLGGTRGSVPVSVDNPLPFAVRVKMQLSYSQADGVTVSSPAGTRTVPAHTAQTVRLRISAAQTGSTTITMTLLNQNDQPLASPPVRTTVQTTQVGLLGMIIFGAALGVFLLASAARAVRRGKPRPTPDEAHRPAPREDDQPGHSTEEAGPDTVVTGHGELGSARSPRPR